MAEEASELQGNREGKVPKYREMSLSGVGWGRGGKGKDQDIENYRYARTGATNQTSASEPLDEQTNYDT